MTGGVLSPGGARGVGWDWMPANGIVSVVIGGLAPLSPFSATDTDRATLVMGVAFLVAGMAAFAAATGGGAAIGMALGYRRAR